MMRKTISILLVLVAALTAVAQDFTPVLNDIIASYAPWTSAEFSGKLRTDKLPVTPTVKMYMVRDSLLQISVRAPLLGEVGRLNLTKDELLIVNKMKKVYCQESPDRVFELYPSLLEDLQSLFLARVVVLGDGELDGDNVATVDIEEDGADSWLVLPQTDPGVVPFEYGYLVSANSRTRALMAFMGDKGSLTVVYSYKNGGMTMDINLNRKNHNDFTGQLEFSSVKWGGTEMASPRVSAYRKVGIKEFLSSVKGK